MAGLHCWMKSYSKPDTPQGAGVQVRYLKRTGEFDPVHYLNRSSTRTKDYGDFVDGNTQHLPSWAANDPERFFLQAATSEGANRYYMFQVQFSLPNELTDEQQHALRQDFMDATIPDLPAMWVIHNKELESGEMHPHVHVLFSARKDDGIERDPAQTFMRWDRRDPEKGGCEKDLFWSKRQAPAQLREAFTDLSNYHLERAHVAARVDPRSLKRREIRRFAIGRGSERPDAATLAQEHVKAAEAWELRKAYKDISDVQAIPREEFVLLVRQWTRDYDRGQQLPRVSHAEVQTWTSREQTRLATEHAAVDQRLAQVERGLAGKLRAHELLALTRHQTQDDPMTPGLRARIFEDDEPGYRY
jgi:hypothetical protein